MEDWAEIRRLHRAEGLPIKAIVRVLGVSRNTVRAAIASDVPPKYERTPAGSIVDEGRTTYVAGEIAQCDLWFPPIHLPVGFGQVRRPLLPVLTMITGYSRWLSAMLIPTRSAADLFAGWWQLIEKLGAVPRVVVWNGDGAIGAWHRSGVVGLGFRKLTHYRIAHCSTAAHSTPWSMHSDAKIS